MDQQANEIETSVNKFLSDCGVTYKVSYVSEVPSPWNEVDNKRNVDQWMVRFTKANVPEFQTMFFTGLGCRKSTHTCSGTVKKPVNPSLSAVLFSLVNDSAALEDSFDNWCDDYGFESDSIKIFNTYQECCEIGRKLLKIFSKKEITQLREILQDY